MEYAFGVPLHSNSTEAHDVERPQTSVVLPKTESNVFSSGFLILPPFGDPLTTSHLDLPPSGSPYHSRTLRSTNASWLERLERSSPSLTRTTNAAAAATYIPPSESDSGISEPSSTQDVPSHAFSFVRTLTQSSETDPVSLNPDVGRMSLSPGNDDSTGLVSSGQQLSQHTHAPLVATPLLSLSPVNSFDSSDLNLTQLMDVTPPSPSYLNYDFHSFLFTADRTLSVPGPLSPSSLLAPTPPTGPNANHATSLPTDGNELQATAEGGPLSLIHSPPPSGPVALLPIDTSPALPRIADAEYSRLLDEQPLTFVPVAQQHISFFDSPDPDTTYLFDLTAPSLLDDDVSVFLLPAQPSPMPENYPSTPAHSVTQPTTCASIPQTLNVDYTLSGSADFNPFQYPMDQAPPTTNAGGYNSPRSPINLQREESGVSSPLTPHTRHHHRSFFDSPRPDITYLLDLTAPELIDNDFSALFLAAQAIPTPNNPLNAPVSPTLSVKQPNTRVAIPQSSDVDYSLLGSAGFNPSPHSPLFGTFQLPAISAPDASSSSPSTPLPPHQTSQTSSSIPHDSFNPHHSLTDASNSQSDVSSFFPDLNPDATYLLNVAPPPILGDMSADM